MGFGHVYSGTFCLGDLRAAIELEVTSQWRNRPGLTPSVVYINGSNIKLRELKAAVTELNGQLGIYVIYEGKCFYNADALEKECQKQLLAEFPNSPKVGYYHIKGNERLMFTGAGYGTCRPHTITPGTPYPCYTAVHMHSLTLLLPPVLRQL